MNIQRPKLIKELENFSAAGNGVVVGTPGIGKSFLLRDICSKKRNLESEYLYLPLDKIDASDSEMFKKDLKIKGNLGDYLRDQIAKSGKKKGLVVFDSFDSLRSEEAKKFYLRMIKELIAELFGKWNVLVSVRTYDAKNMDELLNCFPAKGGMAPEEYRDVSLKCRNFYIPELTEGEVKESFVSIRGLEAYYSTAGDDFKKLTRNPFNLWLLEQLATGDQIFTEFQNVISDVQLLSLYWKKRVATGGHQESKRLLLSKIAIAMTKNYSLSIRKDEVFEIGAEAIWAELMSSEVLSDYRYSDQRVAFGHNILFDFAVSVLLMEDSYQSLMKFIAEDVSRTVFLRPSLNYYFKRLWHYSNGKFWELYWSLYSTDKTNVVVLMRMMPTLVIISEAIDSAQLDPLIEDSVIKTDAGKDSLANLFQSLRSLRMNRMEMWVKFLNKLVKSVDGSFAWEYSAVLTLIGEEALGKENNNLLKEVGAISRDLLWLFWDQRKAVKNKNYLDRLITVWTIPLIIKTFGTNPKDSRSALDEVLKVMDEENYSLDYLYHLTEGVDRIWNTDPDFVRNIYLTVFSRNETSQEKTHMGGFVMSFTSTRRQDFDMCRWRLIQVFPKFIEDKPFDAVDTALNALFYFIKDEHVLKYLKPGANTDDMIQRFRFRGKDAHYVEDGSVVWDESTYHEQELGMANHVFEFINSLEETPEDEEILGKILDIFAESATFAYFWKHLMMIGEQKPNRFSKYLFELAKAKPILNHVDTLHEVGKFLSACSRHFSSEQRAEVEKEILNMPLENAKRVKREYLEDNRNRLICCIPKDLLVLNESKDLVDRLQKEKRVPANRPLVSSGFEQRAYTEDMWLKEQKVDVEDASNKEFRQLLVPLDEFSKKWLNGIPDKESVVAIYPQLKVVSERLDADRSVDRLVTKLGREKLATGISYIAKAAKDLTEEQFNFCRNCLIQMAKDPEPTPNPDIDNQYSTPHWSFSPRTQAGAGLAWLAGNKPDDTLIQAISALAVDPVPSVRYVTVVELFRLYFKSPIQFWELAKTVGRTEKNRTVQQALCQTVYRIIGKEEEKVAEVLDLLVKKDEGEANDYFVEALMGPIVWLLLVRQNKWASEVMDRILDKPLQFSTKLYRATFDALEYFTPEHYFSNDDDWKRPVANAYVFLERAIEASLKGVKEIYAHGGNELSDQQQGQLKEMFGVIDHMVTRFYFDLEIRDNINSKPGKLTEIQQKEFYLRLKPLLLKILDKSMESQNGLVIAPTAHHFMQILNGVLQHDPQGALEMAARVVETSKQYGFNLDSMAAKDVVEIAEAVINNHKEILKSGKPMEDLLDLLQAFAVTGWPDARKLIWRLDEIFR